MSFNKLSYHQMTISFHLRKNAFFLIGLSFVMSFLGTRELLPFLLLYIYTAVLKFLTCEYYRLCMLFISYQHKYRFLISHLMIYFHLDNDWKVYKPIMQGKVQWSFLCHNTYAATAPSVLSGLSLWF